VEHARNQYTDLGRPPKPDVTQKGKKNKVKEFHVSVTFFIQLVPQ